MASELWSSSQSWFLMFRKLDTIFGIFFLNPSFLTALSGSQACYPGDSIPDVSMGGGSFHLTPPPLGGDILLLNSIFLFPLFILLLGLKEIRNKGRSIGLHICISHKASWNIGERLEMSGEIELSNGLWASVIGSIPAS